MKASFIAVTFAAGLGAGYSPCALAGGAPVRDAVPALESMQPGIVECVPSRRNPAPAGNASAIVGAYLRIHAAVRADATIIGLPSREINGGAAAGPASDCTGEETPVLWDSGRVVAVMHAGIPSGASSQALTPIERAQNA